MSLAGVPLPTDPDALRMFAAGLQAELARKGIEITARDAEIHAKTLHIGKLRTQLAVLRRVRFGWPSGKLGRGIEQLELLIGELEEQAEGDPRAGATDPAGPQPKPGRASASWVRQTMFPAANASRFGVLVPLAEATGCHVRTGAVLHADDTAVPVLAPGLGKTRTGRLWVVARDKRPWGSDVPSAAFHRYPAHRRGMHAQMLLGSCHGFLHTDGYAGETRSVCPGFDAPYAPARPAGGPSLVEVACWSHARWKSHDVYYATASPVALEALQRIAALFAIESGIRAPLGSNHTKRPLQLTH